MSTSVLHLFVHPHLLQKLDLHGSSFPSKLIFTIKLSIAFFSFLILFIPFENIQYCWLPPSSWNSFLWIPWHSKNSYIYFCPSVSLSASISFTDLCSFSYPKKDFLRLVLCLCLFTLHSSWRVQHFYRTSSYYLNENYILSPSSNWFSDPNFQLLDISIKYTHRLIWTKYVPKPISLLCFLF